MHRKRRECPGDGIVLRRVSFELHHAYRYGESYLKVLLILGRPRQVLLRKRTKNGYLIVFTRLMLDKGIEKRQLIEAQTYCDADINEDHSSKDEGEQRRQ